MNEQLSNNEVGFATDLNDIDIPLEVARSDSKYYLNSNKPNDEHKRIARQSPTPYPTLTDSQQIQLNIILHTGKLTNCNVSTFSDDELIEPEVEPEIQNVHCCNII